MAKLLAVLYGIVSYVVFLASILYAVGFVGGFCVSKTIDSGERSGLIESLAVNLLLMTLFAVQHSVMARPAFKARWTRIVSPAIERSTYVLAASLLLFLLYWQWRPLPQVVWRFEGAGALVLQALFWLGWAIVLLSTFMISHLELFGLRQVLLHFQGKIYQHGPFRQAGFYRIVRHPIMLGFIIAFWATPVLTLGHLLFAAVTTAYILVALQVEERDLVAALGEAYRDYRTRVPMLIPGMKKKG
jgi:protein-S-isoprenylcysteine O-methyltransferase Ste14